MEKIKILCTGFKNKVDFDYKLILEQLYNKIKKRVELNDEKLKFDTYENYGLYEKDEEEQEVLQITSNFKYKNDNYKLVLSKSTFDNNIGVIYVNITFNGEDLKGMYENNLFNSELYEFKISIKNILGSIYEEIYWQKDTQNEKISSFLYLKVHDIENRFREVINDYMVRIYGLNWFHNNINPDYYKKYKEFSAWFRKSKYSTFKNIKTELFNLQITDLIQMLKNSTPNVNVNSVQGSINNIKSILKENVDKVLIEDILNIKSIWDEENFDDIWGKDIEGIWDNFSKMRNMIAHNKPICKELFKDIISDVNILILKFNSAEQIINRKIKSHEEKLVNQIIKDETDRFYLIDCGYYEEHLDVQDIIEKLADRDEVIELFTIFEKYEDEIKNQIEDMEALYCEIFDYIQFENIVETKNKFKLLNEVLFFNDNYCKERYEKYIDVMRDFEGLQLIKSEFEDILENKINELRELTKKLLVSKIEELHEGKIVNLIDLKGNFVRIEVEGWFVPERGRTDEIYLKTYYNSKIVDIHAGIEVSYGDYELIDDSYSNPSWPNGIDENVRELINYLNSFVNENLKVFKNNISNLESIIG